MYGCYICGKGFAVSCGWRIIIVWSDKILIKYCCNDCKGAHDEKEKKNSQ